MKLRAFIGSSSESLNVANAIRNALQAEGIECKVWTEGFFRLSHFTLETLSNGVDEFDVGIFIFGEDDTVSSRGVVYSATRDNVVFELGLFCGRLGPKRTFVARPSSKSLRWLSDLDGFTPAHYDETLAKTNAEKATKQACEQILDAFRHLVPRPGIYFKGGWRPLGQEWWTYAGTETSSTAADEHSIQLITQNTIGLMFPHLDNLTETGRFCAVRLQSTSDGKDGVFYVSLRARGEKIFLSLSASHENEGWGTPSNEFMLRLPHLEAGRYHSFVIDFQSLEPFIGPAPTVNGFRVRPGLKVSHICVFDELPVWLKSATVLDAAAAPAIAVEHPAPDAVVEQEQQVQGTLRIQKASISHTDIQVFVLAGNSWYPQGPLSVTGGRWQVKAYFGDSKHGAGSEFQIAAITTGGSPTVGTVKELPPALGRSIVRVTRRK